MIAIETVQRALCDEDLDAWVLFDFRGSNPIGGRMMGLNPKRPTTRRWFYIIPRRGIPTAVVHAVEARALETAPGARQIYGSHSELTAILQRQLGSMKRVAMEYSHLGALPYISRVDAGTIEMIRAIGPEVASSADLVQMFEARLTDEQRQLHDRAAERVLAAKDAAFDLVREKLRAESPVLESGIQAFIVDEFRRHGLIFDHPPIVAVNEHASDPHFETLTGADDRPVRRGDVLLIDLWAKLSASRDAVYYDTTWMAYCDANAPEEVLAVWQSVREARDAAVSFIKESMASRSVVRGCDIDDVARGVIVRHGYGSFFVHRTGHSIGTEVHGNGANIDNFETHDERRIIPGLCFSIEPGIYLPAFGMRSEIDVFIGPSYAEVTGAIQSDLILLS